MRQTVLALVLGLVVGYAVSDYQWTTKHNDYLQTVSKTQQEELDAKDKTITLVIERYNTLKGVSDKSSALVGRLRYQLNQANRAEENTRLRGCQELLSEGIELLREGQGLAEKLSIAQ